MSINGISGAITTPLIRPQEAARPKADQETGQAQAAATAATRQAERATRVAAPTLLAPRQEALPAEAPDGTDPQLWQVLTTEERAFFARMTAMGPLTYGRSAAGAPSSAPGAGETPLLRGGRIDVRA